MDFRFLMLLENYSHADRNYTDAYIPVYSKPKWGLNDDGMAEKEDKMTAPAVPGQRGDGDSLTFLAPAPRSEVFDRGVRKHQGGCFRAHVDQHVGS